MNNKLLKYLNPVLFIVAVIQIWTALVIFFGHDEGLIELHVKNGFLLIVLILIHFSLNFGWVKAQIFKGKQ
jgi:high-affinity K+ transport system ATPase subunit B